MAKEYTTIRLTRDEVDTLYLMVLGYVNERKDHWCVSDKEELMLAKVQNALERMDWRRYKGAKI